MLDVYSPRDAKNLPVVFWIHGGGWQTGDKSSVQIKPQAFMDKGFVFVSTNYRLLPNVDMETIVRDIAKSIRWVHDHIAEYGGDPERLFVMGHSAGAARRAGLHRRSLPEGRGPVPGDHQRLRARRWRHLRRAGHHRDGGDPSPGSRPAQAKLGHREKFGNDPAKHRDLSAVTHVARDKNIPPFLILHVADHPDTSAQAQRLAGVLKARASPSRSSGPSESTHNKINADLGLPDDPATKALFEFVGRALKK